MNSLRIFWFLLVTMLSFASVQSLPFIVVAYPSLAQRDAEDGVTALMRAARDGERKNVKVLLEQGVDVNARDSGGWSALTYAAAKGDLVIAKALVSKGAEVDPKEVETTPLMAAVTYRNVAVVKMLIEHGANVNQANGKGATALGAALRSHQDRMVEVLRSAGAMEALPQAIPESAAAEDAVDSKPILLNAPQPVYTTKARNEHIEGVVRARILVGSDGTVKRVKILTGLPYGLSYQAMDAAYQLIFKPARKDGRPVEYWLSVEMEFKLV